MGLLESIGGMATKEALKRMGLGYAAAAWGYAAAAWGAYEKGITAAEGLSAAQRALAETDPNKKLLDNLIRNCTGSGTYLRDYAFFDAEYLEDALRYTRARNGNLTFIRLTRRYHGQSTESDVRASDYFLVNTLNAPVHSADGLKVITAVTVMGNQYPGKQFESFVRAFLSEYGTRVDERRQRINAFERAGARPF